MPKPLQRTRLGRYFVGECESILRSTLGRALQGRVQLILTSPPYPLNRKKSYGNLTGDDYRRWFVELALLFAKLLRPDGSIVIELGNAWIRGRPVQSLLHLKSLMGFVENKDAGPLQQCSRDRQTLPLTARELAAIRTNPLMEPIRKRRKKIRQVRLLDRSAQLEI